VFVLIGGERRWRAFHIIAERTTTDPIINCFIDTVHDERHHFREAFLDNLLREDLIPVDEAAAYERLYKESRGESHHAKVVEIASLAKKSTSHVENYLQLARLADGVKLLMDPRRKKEEQLGTSIAIEIAKSTDNPTLQLELAKEALERNLGVVEARTLIQVKTGKSGYGVGGRMRQPKDDYRMFVTYLSTTLRGIQNFRRHIDLDGLYAHRDDEFAERERDSATIRLIVGHLNDALKQVEGQPTKKGGAS
jgi:ParB/RepB/Spo0J family partition protein